MALRALKHYLKVNGNKCYLEAGPIGTSLRECKGLFPPTSLTPKVQSKL